MARTTAIVAAGLGAGALVGGILWWRRSSATVQQDAFVVPPPGVDLPDVGAEDLPGTVPTPPAIREGADKAAGKAAGKAVRRARAAAKGRRKPLFVDPAWPKWVKDKVNASNYKGTGQRRRYAAALMKAYGARKGREARQAAALAAEGSYAQLFKALNDLHKAAGARARAALPDCPRATHLKTAVWPDGVANTKVNIRMTAGEAQRAGKAIGTKKKVKVRSANMMRITAERHYVRTHGKHTSVAAIEAPRNYWKAYNSLKKAFDNGQVKYKCVADDM